MVALVGLLVLWYVGFIGKRENGVHECTCITSSFLLLSSLRIDPRIVGHLLMSPVKSAGLGILISFADDQAGIQ